MKPIAGTLIRISLVLCLAAGLTACGVKAPPLPPLEKGAVAVPGDFNATVQESGVTLSWTYPKAKGVLPAQAFEVSLAELDNEACQGCPLTFRVIERVDASVTSLFVKPSVDVDSYFRVQALGENEIRGAYSKSLKVEKK